ncbi:MAG: Trp family transcriptional regulator [bacterium]|nr:Trp family transcriptional regulator [bacterium]
MDKKCKKELLDAFLKIKNPALMDAFLRDILTPAEYSDIIARWQIVKALANDVPQREIARKLKVSISKITRGSRELLDKQGGFWKVLKMTK